MKIKDIVEARMSAAVKLQRAFEREQSKSTASKERADQAKGEFEKTWKAKQEKEKQGVAEGSLNEFAQGNGGDDGEAFNPGLAKMAQEHGFTKGVSLADGASLATAFKITEWDQQFGGLYKQHFVQGFKEGRMDKINHNNKQYNLNLKLMKDGSIRHGEQGVAEGFNGEYDDEAGMADNNLETLRRAVDGIDNVINTGDNLPEWCQEKIAVAKSMLVTVWDYMRSEEQIEDPEIAEMYEAMQLMAESMAHKHRVSVDLVWESFEALDDHMLYETAAWRRKEGKSAKGGLNAKGVASYRRENPGSKLQTAVTTKPSKLKPGSKAAKRRKSFCARMSGVKGPAKKPNGKPTRKTLALRKWNC